MFDIGWSELLLIGVVALIVVGPKDLPKMFRTLGQFTAKARNMAREFQRAMEDAADATGAKDVARDLRNVTNPQSMGLDELKKFKNWDPLKPDAEPRQDKPADPEDDMDRVIAEMDKLKRAKAPKTEPSADPAPAPAPASPSAPAADKVASAAPDADSPKA